MIAKHKPLHPRDDVDRLYVSRKEGGKRLTNIEYCVGASIRVLEDYIKENKEEIITALSNSAVNIRINRKTITKKQKWEEKQLYGYFVRQTDEVSHEKT